MREPVAHLGGEDVRLTDGPSRLGVDGLAVHRGRGVGLDDPAVPHDRDAVGHGHRLALVVGHEERGRPGGPERVHDSVAGLGPQGGVQGRERFVQQEQGRAGGQRPRERDPLLLPARELMGSAVPDRAIEPDELEQLIDPVLLPALSPGEPEDDVRRDIEVGEQRTLLRHVPHPPTLGGHERPVAGHDVVAQPDRAGVRCGEPGDEPQQGRLAAARGTQDCRQITDPDREVDAVEHRVGAEGLAHAVDRQRGHVRWRSREGRVKRYVAGRDSSTMSNA